ncbi:flagellar motor protein MotB [Verticiella sediminum]|uniref:Flagellar motor protein MotB n=1 Tax=Verticiella sediminum TaxID=1247510 RepID=A0A556ARW8_9BURK|nr:flagellar motor protein MotB [Verticiella sediminum]TSH95701.1 flagellar motor protein MotB [Verticiella sediminum]
MSPSDTPRVVVRRKANRYRPHYGGSWKIAYADFVTAMMAFFLVMWLIMITSPQGREGIAEYFRTPLGVAMAGGPDRSASDSPIPAHPRDSVIPLSGGDPRVSEGIVRRADPSPQTRQQSETERRDRARLENLRARLEAAIERNPVLRQYRPQLLVDMTSEGLRVQIVDDQNRPMFATGSAQIAPYMRAILREIGPMLNELPNRVSLAGHTDAMQYSQGERGYSNWELSADRANASRRELVAGGMHEEKVLRMMGLSSTQPLAKDDPYAAVNRRISLVVLNRATELRIERENASAADIQAMSASQAQAGIAGDPPDGGISE